MSQSTLSRRSFVAASAVAFAGAGAGVALAAEPASSEAPVSFDEECDVLVAGAGIAGMVAALAAEEAGAKVVVVEKRLATGGSASKSSGFMVTAESDKFEDGVDTSIDTLMDYLMGVHNQAEDTESIDEDFLRSVFSQSGKTIDFMLGLGMEASFITLSTPVTTWSGGGSGMMASLTQIAQDRGVEVRLNTSARQILTEDGAVCGLTVVAADGTQTNIGAKKVVLATGGCTFNKARLQREMPTLANMTLIDFAEQGDTGDSLDMAEAIGAAPAEPMRLLGAGCDFDQAWRKSITDRSLRPSLADHALLNDQGKRFTNEAPSENTMMTYYLEKEGSTAYWLIYDGVSNPDIVPVLENGVTLAAVVKGDDLAGLAEQMGVDAAVLQETLETYNSYCEAGEDKDFGKAADNLVAYDLSGALYAVKIYCATWGTIGGLQIDDTAHVLDTEGKVIENLFACGASANRCLFSDFYIGGNSLATSATVGRIAGETAVAEIKG